MLDSYLSIVLKDLVMNPALSGATLEKKDGYIKPESSDKYV